MTNGQKVYVWSDKSGNGWDASQPSTINAPTFSVNQLNSYPAITFNRLSAPQFLQVTHSQTGNLMSNSNTIFVVSKGTSGGSSGSGQGYYQVIFSTGYGYITGIMYTGYPNISKTTMAQWLGGDGLSPSSSVTGASNTTQNTWQISTQWTNEQSGQTSFKAYVNGSDVALKTSELPMSDYTNYNIATIGAYAASGYMAALNGAISEIIVYNMPLNNAQRTIVDNYLSSKYNIPISDDYYFGHDVSYTRDIMGIGTWQGQPNNKVVSSTNEKGLVLQELDGTLNANNEYLLAGHATPNNIETSDNLPGAVSKRWARDWYIQKTGNINSKIIFDFSEADITYAINDQRLENYYLLYRPTVNSNFVILSGNSGPIIPTLTEGDQIGFYVPNNLLNTGYYTIGYGSLITWVGSSDNNWDNPLNWDLDRVPEIFDDVVINNCITCPELITSPSILNLHMYPGSHLSLSSNSLTIKNNASFNEAILHSVAGVIHATDFGELKNCKILGRIELVKAAGTDNICYGGNIFSSEVKFSNHSTKSWNLGHQANNRISTID